MAYVGQVPSELPAAVPVGRGYHQGRQRPRAARAHAGGVVLPLSGPQDTASAAASRANTTQQVQEIAWRAQKRLCGRYRHLTERGKPAGKVITALGRELLGFIWTIAWETMPTKTA